MSFYTELLEKYFGYKKPERIKTANDLEWSIYIREVTENLKKSLEEYEKNTNV